MPPTLPFQVLPLLSRSDCLLVRDSRIHQLLPGGEQLGPEQECRPNSPNVLGNYLASLAGQGIDIPQGVRSSVKGVGSKDHTVGA